MDLCNITCVLPFRMNGYLGLGSEWSIIKLGNNLLSFGFGTLIGRIPSSEPRGC